MSNWNPQPISLLIIIHNMQVREGGREEGGREGGRDGGEEEKTAENVNKKCHDCV